VFELVIQAAQQLGHSYVVSEHLLVGLIEEEDGMAGVFSASTDCRQKQSGRKSKSSAKKPKKGA
jgi:ATP-dependent Clp protease ATP-binding subunit ClpA